MESKIDPREPDLGVRYMKRFAAFLFAAAAAFSLVSCSLPPLPELPDPPRLSAAPTSAPEPAEEQSRETAEEKISLDILLCSRGDGAEAFFLAPGTGFVDRFEAENPSVTLRLKLAAAEDMPQILRARIAGGEAPDVVGCDSVLALVSGELLMSTEEYCPAELRGGFYPAFLDEAALGRCELPDLVSVRTLYCSAGLLERSGAAVPATRAELEESCRRIAEACGEEVCPFGLSMTESESAACFACFAWSGGGGFVGTDGAWALGSDENAEALAFAVDLVNKALSNPNPAAESAEELCARFAEGKLAMLLTDGRLISGALPALFPAAGEAPGAAVAEATRIAVFRDGSAPDQSARSEAVGKFLRFYYAPENYAGRARLAGLLPAAPDAAELLARGEASYAAWPEILPFCRLLPVGKPGWDAVSAGLYSIEQLSLLGGDIRAALDELQASLPGGA